MIKDNTTAALGISPVHPLLVHDGDKVLMY
jgi:hypothetical protein